MSGKSLRQMEKAAHVLTKYLSMVGAFAQIIMVMIIVVDVTLRIFSLGIPGSYELVELAMVPLVFFVIPRVQAEKKNIDMDLLYILFPKKGRYVIDLVNYLICCVLCGFFTCASVLQAINNSRVHEATGVLLIPLHWFNLLAGVGFGLLTLVLLIDVLFAIGRMIGRLEEAVPEEEASFSASL